MAQAFTRTQRRFACLGVQLVPPETVAAGKFPVLTNVRSYVPGTVQSRAGLTALAGASFGSAVHSLGRLNDATAYAATPFWRVFGAGASLYAGAPSSYPSIDTGYSGDPLTFVPILPVSAPNPWLGIVDRARMRKIDVNGHVYPLGIAAPTSEPTAYVAPLYTAIVTDYPAGVAWVDAGASASGLTSVNRINTTISSLLADGDGSGNLSVAPVSFDGIDTGTLITFQGGETLPVQQVTVAVVPTTIAAILYDSGTSGVCTIQPAGSLGVGQLEGPDFSGYAARAGAYGRISPSDANAADVINARVAGVVARATAAAEAIAARAAAASPAGQPQSNPTARIRQIDFPVNSLVVLGGTETVRILSVAVGRDGIQSFRCVTTGTFAAGATITGLAAFRVTTQTTYAPGDTLVASAYQNTITPAGSPPTATAGIQSGVGWTPAASLATINGRATQPDDDVHLAIRFSDCTVVQSVRVYLDVDAALNNFTQNYYFYEWEPSDIIAAIQATNTAPVDTLTVAQATNLVNNQVNAGSSLPTNNPVGAAGLANNAVSTQLAIGNNQWLELRCKVSDLIQAGTDPTRTLANVAAAEILVAVAGASPITVSYDSLWLSGGYGPDVGALGIPYVYYYRGRSSLTGATSNPSPALRGGMLPQRQDVHLVGVQIPDAQCDLVDWFRFGGALSAPTYTGTGTNGTPPTYDDVNSDAAIVGGETLSYEHFQPWATTDLPRAGTCNVAGNAIQWASGDHFNIAWAPGTALIVNGQTCTLYNQPPSTTLCFVNENIGSGSALPFTVPNPTLLSQNLPSYWGDYQGIFFACGDANNPGTLYWTNANTPEETTDANTLIVTAGSEPLQAGLMWDGTSFVFSTNQLYGLVSNPMTTVFGERPGFVAQITPCGKGLWTRWASCATPFGIVFLADDGIYVTAGGTPAQPLSGDLTAIFPHDGQPGVTVNGYVPPDMTQTARLRLSYQSGWVYFDYVDTGGAAHSLALRASDQSWWPDTYTPGVAARTSEDGAQVYEDLLGGATGVVYLPTGTTDAGTAIACELQIVDAQQDYRAQKLYRDFILDADLTGATLAAQLGFDNNAVTLPAVTLGPATGEQLYYVDAALETGTFGRNLTATLTWNPVAAGLPLLYFWDLAFQPQPELASNWLSGPTTHGFDGYQQVSAVLLAYRASSTVTFSLVVDGVAYTYTLPSTSGLYAKHFAWLQTVKGLTFQYGFQGTAFELFDADCEAWVTVWGDGAGYHRIRPFSAQGTA